MTTYLREIRCLRCGVLYAWSWTEGDNPLTADWQALFKKLKKHQRPSRLHLLYFKEKTV